MVDPTVHELLDNEEYDSDTLRNLCSHWFNPTFDKDTTTRDLEPYIDKIRGFDTVPRQSLLQLIGHESNTLCYSCFQDRHGWVCDETRTIDRLIAKT